jgi:hypothetical protein
MTDSSIISKKWNLAGELRDDGMGYSDYLEQIIYLLSSKLLLSLIKHFMALEYEPASVYVGED